MGACNSLGELGGVGACNIISIWGQTWTGSCHYLAPTLWARLKTQRTGPLFASVLALEERSPVVGMSAHMLRSVYPQLA